MKRRWIDWIFGAPWLGHGRKTEAGLAAMCGIYGIILLSVPDAVFRSVDVADLAWNGFGRLIAIPFLLTAVLTGSGLYCNINCIRYSRVLRIVGALVGCVIWPWIATNLLATHEVVALGFAVSLVNAYLSASIVAMAWADLPKPGTPGQR